MLNNNNFFYKYSKKLENKMNYQFSLSSSRKKKFLSINFNLKNEIFEYLPFAIKLLYVSKIHRNFSYALNKNKIIGYLKANFESLLKKFIDDNLKNLGSLEKSLFLSIPKIKDYEATDLIRYLILKSKIIKDEIFTFNPVLLKYIGFLKFTKDVKGLKFEKLKSLENKEDKENIYNANNLITINSYNEITNILRINKCIKKLIFSDFLFKIPVEEFKELYKILENNKSIKEINFTKCNLFKEIECINILKDILINNYSIISLTIKKDDFPKSPARMKIFEKIFTENKSIKYLKLPSNSIGKSNKAMDSIKNILHKNSSIEYLDFTNNLIKSERNKKIYKTMIINSKSLKGIKFDIYDCGYFLKEKNYEILKNILNKNKYIQELRLKKLDWANDKLGIIDLFEYILKHSTIKEISLKIKNVYCETGWKSFFNFIINNEKIKELKLQELILNSSQKFSAFRNMLVKNTNIENLAIKSMRINNKRKIFKIFEDILFFNSNLKTFEINLSKLLVKEFEFYSDQLKKLSKNNNLKIIYNENS